MISRIDSAASFLGWCTTEKTFRRPSKLCCTYFFASRRRRTVRTVESVSGYSLASAARIVSAVAEPRSRNVQKLNHDQPRPEDKAGSAKWWYTLPSFELLLENLAAHLYRYAEPLARSHAPETYQRLPPRQAACR